MLVFITQVSDRLRACTLWPGSMLEMQMKHKLLNFDVVRKKIAQMKRCDDLTVSEKEFLAALEAEIS